MEITPQETMTTYRRADGDLIFGEWSFATDIDSCQVEADDSDEPVEYVEEVWELKSSRTFTLPTCSSCDEPATHWGLCAKHAEEDDPDAFKALAKEGQSS